MKGKPNHSKTKFRKGNPKPKNAYSFPSGEDNPIWKGGIKKTYGYITILSPDHPNKGKYGYVHRSRLVAEKCLDRYLTPEEVIHHINEIRDDDRPKNLYLFSSQSIHIKFHFLKNKPKLTSNII